MSMHRMAVQEPSPGPGEDIHPDQVQVLGARSTGIGSRTVPESVANARACEAAFYDDTEEQLAVEFARKSVQSSVENRAGSSGKRRNRVSRHASRSPIGYLTLNPEVQPGLDAGESSRSISGTGHHTNDPLRGAADGSDLDEALP